MESGGRTEERKRRIRVSLWAYAYEVANISLVDDATYDRESRLIRPEVETGNAEMDAFFRTVFEPDTGLWIHEHPHKDRLKAILEGIVKRKPEQLTLI